MCVDVFCIRFWVLGDCHCVDCLQDQAHMSGIVSSTISTTAVVFSNNVVVFRMLARRFCNPDMCELTEGVVFVDPFCDAQYNRWTSPQLDADAKGLWSDMEARQAATALKVLGWLVHTLTTV